MSASRPEKPRAMLTPEELAAYLNVPIRTVYRWRTCHTGPRGSRVGKHVRYRPADVEKWLDQQAAGGQAA